MSADPQPPEQADYMVQGGGGPCGLPNLHACSRPLPTHLRGQLVSIATTDPLGAKEATQGHRLYILVNLG